MEALRNTSYAILSPAKDEEKYIQATLQSVVSQTIKPVSWVIIDDGSSDKTIEIIEEFSKRYKWIHLIKTEYKTVRQPGPPVIRAFNIGYRYVKESGVHFDFVVKLDCDLRFDEEYFEKLLTKFVEDEKLGIASGLYFENDGQGWLPAKFYPDYHAAGACKVVRAQLFEEIGGFVLSYGWDTADEIKAQVRGWKTCHFEEIKFYHLKNEGSGIGIMRTHSMLGEVFYLTGGNCLLFFMKIVYRMFMDKPFLLGGLAMLYGYLRVYLKGKKKLVSDEEAKSYRRVLWKRLAGSIARHTPFRT